MNNEFKQFMIGVIGNEPYIHDEEERLAQIDYLLTGMMDWNYAQLANNLNTVLEDEALAFLVAVQKQGWSTSAILLGHAAFYGRRFNVDRRDSRQEPSEELVVEWVLNDYKASGEPKRVLDIGQVQCHCGNHRG